MSRVSSILSIPSGWIRRVTAGFAIALWLFLSASAASPALHHWLHADSADGSDNCAVVQFISGLTLATYADLPALSVRTNDTPAPAEPPALFLAAPRYLRQPERGPPSC
jgi:hypothetical protein